MLSLMRFKLVKNIFTLLFVLSLPIRLYKPFAYLTGDCGKRHETSPRGFTA
jgi:hypothetical protein